MQQIRIHEIKERDSDTVNQLSELLIRVVEDGASIGFLPPLDKKEADHYWHELPMDGVHLWAAVEEGRIVGTVQVHIALKANALHRVEIAKLMVDPDRRRKGISRLLMLAAEERAVAEDRTLLVLDTRAGDVSNYLYCSLGYTETGRIPKYARSADGELHETVFYYKNL